MKHTTKYLVLCPTDHESGGCFVSSLGHLNDRKYLQNLENLQTFIFPKLGNRSLPRGRAARIVYMYIFFPRGRYGNSSSGSVTHFSVQQTTKAQFVLIVDGTSLNGRFIFFPKFEKKMLLPKIPKFGNLGKLWQRHLCCCNPPWGLYSLGQSHSGQGPPIVGGTKGGLLDGAPWSYGGNARPSCSLTPGNDVRRRRHAQRPGRRR